MNSLLLTDGYKLTHHLQYPKGTTSVVSNFTPRSDKYAATKDGVVVFGIQMMLIQLNDHFTTNFFSKPKDEVLSQLKGEFSLYTGMEYDTSHFAELWDLGYLPIEVRSLNEGSICPIRVPLLSIKNTKPEFYWLTNYLETIISNLLWKPITSATIARQYKKIVVKWAERTDKGNIAGVNFQCHDFSMRGMDSIDAAIASGLGHLTSFNGGDTLPVIHGARKYYKETGFIVGGVPATEHSVMCAGSKDDEIGTFRRLLETFPNGILSIVSDTWDLWKVCTEYLHELKWEILERDGKLVIRPDSGDPVDIICGNRNWFIDKEYSGKTDECIYKGVVELLWDIFGGTTNEQGYKVLDPHIGCIYGDSITIERAEQIFTRLEAKGFASTNVVLGIGSYTYQYNTRDTYGFAMKATYVEIHGEGRPIFKDPITDDGMKKSAKGLIMVKNRQLVDEVSWDDVNSEENELKIVYSNGQLTRETTLTEIKQRLDEVS